MLHTIQRQLSARPTRIFTDNNLSEMELLHAHISSTILKAFYTVAHALPYGLDKSFYCNGLAIELQHSGLQVDSNRQQNVLYKNSPVGQFIFDLTVNNTVIVQVSTEAGFIEPPQIELSKNYLKLTDFEVLLLLNFGAEADHKHIFLSNDYKNRY